MELSLEQLEAILQAAYEKGRLSVVKSWDESQHPRDKIGEFASAGESSGIPSREELLDLFNGFSHEGQKEFDWDHATYAPDSSSADDTVPGFTKDFDEYLSNKDGYAELASTLAPDKKAFLGEYDKLREKLVAAGDGFKSELTDLIKAAGKYHALKSDIESLKLSDLEVEDYGYPPGKPRNPDKLPEYEAELAAYKETRAKAIADAKAKRKAEVDGLAKDIEPLRERYRERSKAALMAFRKINKVNARIDDLITPLHDVDDEQKSFRPAVVKSWDEKQHPRGDDGRFINKDEISQAAKNPRKAAELRQRVTDPAERGKLDRAIGNADKNQQYGKQFAQPSAGFGAGLGPKRPASREPGETATTGHHPHGDHPSVHETVGLVRGLRDKSLDETSRAELAERLQGHTVDELQEIKRQLGIRATGRKAELAGKILMAASGHEYPEQGFTGALPVKGQGIHHYEDGVLQHIEREPSPGLYSSRATPEEAAAVIDWHISRGTLLKPETRAEIANLLMHRMSYRDISELKRQLGLKASGKKQVYAERIQALVEDRERRARQNPDHPANKPDPMGTMGSLAERLADIESKRLTYGPANLQHPDRKAAIDEAADRLRLAVQSPFAAFNREAALGEVKAAMNDLYNTGEFAAAAHLAGIKLDPKDGTPIQQMAAAIFKLSGGDDSPMAQKPTNLLDGLGSEQTPMAIPANHTHKITGDTYPHRDAIKRAGGTWDKVAKQWTIDEEGAQYLPDGLTAEAMAHRQPKTDTAVKPADSKTLFDDVKDKGTPPAPLPTVPDHIRKQAEELKDWHQKASRHEVEYQKMLPWNADMMRKGDEAQRADVAKRMGELIRKHPELADEYGPYVKKGPNLPAPPTPEEHLAKHGEDANPHQVVDDYMAAGGHPNDLRRHLNPETAKESYSNRTGLISARSKAIREVGEHLASKAGNVTNYDRPEGGGISLTRNQTNHLASNEFPDLVKPEHSVSEVDGVFLPQEDRGKGIGQSMYLDAMNKHGADWYYGKRMTSDATAVYKKLAEKGLIEVHWKDGEPSYGERGGPHVARLTDAGKVPATQGANNDIGNANSVQQAAQTDKQTNSEVGRGATQVGSPDRNGGSYDRAEELSREQARFHEDIEREKYGGRTKKEHQEFLAAEGERKYAENIRNPEWVESQIAIHREHTNRLGLAGRPSGSNSADEAAHQRFAESLRAEHKSALAGSDVSDSDTSPGRTDHLQAVASGSGHDELRDAADTVARIEDIPHGERTADDRAELKRAKELAAANDVQESRTSPGAKNPAQYVDDHPEVTADNPLGLPNTSNIPNGEQTPQSVAAQDDSGVRSASVRQEMPNTPNNAEQSNDRVAEPDTHAAKIADLEAKMAEARHGRDNKSNGKGDRAVWSRHHDELEDQHNALTGKVRTLAEHEQHLARAKKLKNHERVAKLEADAPAVHAQHIDNHLTRLDKRIAKMDEANTWAAHVGKEYGKIKWDGQMETVYSDLKEAHESGMSKHLFADAEKGEKGESIETIAKQMQTNGSLQVPEDRHADDYLIEKLSSGETFDGGHDEHRQKLAAERDAIHSERDGKPETDAAIVATLTAGKTPKGKSKPKEPETTGSVTPAEPSTPAGPTPTVPERKEHSLDEIMGAAAGQDAKGMEERPKHNYPRNPDGSFAEIHGAYSGQEKRPVKGTGVASDNRSTNKEKERPAPREWTPEEIERKKRDVEDQKHWDELNRSPLGSMAWLGEKPNSKATGQPRLKDWREFAEKVGPEKIAKLISEIEPQIHAEIDEQTAGLADKTAGPWFKDDLKKRRPADAEANMRGGKGHEKKVPGSHYARELIGEMLSPNNFRGANRVKQFHKVGQILSKLLDDPNAPDTSTSHGQASAVPIGVTQKDDYESRGRGVRKSAAVESPVYLLPL